MHSFTAQAGLGSHKDMLRFELWNCNLMLSGREGAVFTVNRKPFTSVASHVVRGVNYGLQQPNPNVVAARTQRTVSGGPHSGHELREGYVRLPCGSHVIGDG